MPDLEVIQHRHSSYRLVFLFKVVEMLIPAINPDRVVKPHKPKRSIKPKSFNDYIIERHSVDLDRGFIVYETKLI